MIPSTADAVAASVEVAALLDLPTDDPVVVAEGYSVRVRLDPAPVLTRVVTVGRILRGDPLAWMQREVAVSRWLVQQGAPVVRPWPDAGPHVVDGLEVSLWEWAEPAPRPVSAHEFAVLLAELHDVLAGHAEQDLPLLIGAFTDIESALRVSHDPLLHASADRLLPIARTWPRRPLHGDAHLGNLLSAEEGLRWMDLEDVCSGPLEWDLASMTLTDEHVDAYPGELDRTRLEQCRDLRALQVLAALLTDKLQDAEALVRVRDRLSGRSSSASAPGSARRPPRGR